MPLIDGIEATRLIRAFEEQNITPSIESAQTESAQTEAAQTESQAVLPKKRIAIIAVSASLAEHRIEEYINAGFDGWILKPIDFKRLEVILAAIEDGEVRKGILHGINPWEHGGWFHDKEPISVKI